VVDIYKLAGVETPELSILSDEFLDSLADKEKPNLQMGLLRRLINDEIKSVQRQRVLLHATVLERCGGIGWSDNRGQQNVSRLATSPQHAGRSSRKSVSGLARCHAHWALGDRSAPTAEARGRRHCE
jgi:Domain of unknown function (DUF3387)